MGTNAQSTIRPSIQQKEFLIDHLLASYEFANKQPHGKSSNVPINWNELSEILNSLGGSYKSPKQWHRFWMDQRREVQRKFDEENHEDIGIMRNTMKSYERKIIELLRPEILQTEQEPDFGFDSSTRSYTNVCVSFFLSGLIIEINFNRLFFLARRFCHTISNHFVQEH